MFQTKTVEKIQVSLKSDKNNGTLHDRYAFMVNCRIFLRMRNVSDKDSRESQTTLCVL